MATSRTPAVKRAVTRAKAAPRDVLRALKAEFDRVHAKGMQALKDSDLEKLGDAIQKEREIIEKQEAVLEAAMRKTRRR